MKNQIFLYGLLIIFTVLSRLKIYSTGEFAFLEITQVIVIFVNIIYHLKSKKLILKYATFFEFLTRISLLIFILYEELSFLTANKFEFINALNHQSELSIHNLNIMRAPVLGKINIPFFDYEFTIVLAFVFFSLIFFLMGYGYKFKFLKKYPLLFLEKRLSIFSFVYIVNTIISSNVVNSFKFLEYEVSLNLQSGEFFLHTEYMELFIYFLLLLDTIHKVKKIKLDKFSNKY